MLDHGNSQLLGWVCGDRSAETGEQIIPEHCDNITAIYADDYPGYPQIAGEIPLIVGKQHTVPIERNNGCQRRWLASFHRRTMVVTRSLHMLEARMRLFARYRINGSIQGLLRADRKEWIWYKEVLFIEGAANESVRDDMSRSNGVSNPSLPKISETLGF